VSEGRRLVLTGTVQGVGYRPFVLRLARELELSGRVRNDAAGLTIEAFGAPERLAALEVRLRAERPASARIETFAAAPIPHEGAAGFEIVESAGGAERRVPIPPDLATCPDCLRELRDPADRRFGYPFTNCTACGPRFTIALDVPYDRPATTMAGFALCPACAREYRDPADRRFHAQPIACPACGPRVSLHDAAGAPVTGPDAADPIAAVARALREGRIAAVKGIGGFHLACDATSPAAVARLRARKRREEKPLAVMVAGIDDARALAALSPEEEALLTSVERPIVLCRRRPGGALAPELAPGSPLVGLLLAYSPLHALLLEEAGRPLVMTSGNLTDEPIAFQDDDALARLAGIADLFLLHDRPIATRCDDSVARVVAGRPMVTRRARGWVPRPLRLASPVARPVLAAGAQLKNAFCIARGDEAVFGPHAGDLDDLSAYDAWEDSIARLERFLGVRPELLACDLHPLFIATRYARARAASLGVPLVEVQHHHAHAVSAMVEHRLPEPVLALAWDGTGLGTDGAAWGGELLLAWRDRFERLGTFRPVALAGGDRAIREPWRVALAALLDAFDGEAPLERLPLFSAIDARELEPVRRMIAASVNAPLAHGVGRVFDAAGALALARPRSHFEGQIALALDAAHPAGASLSPTGGEGQGEGAYPFDLSGDTLRTVDLRPLWRALAADVIGGVPPGAISARFHAALAAAGAALVREARSAHGDLPVVLTGGCFQNAHLSEGLLGALGGAPYIHLHGSVPPGDGGLALGQAIAADAIAARRQGA
jgi:hydrogenase maturation protein HypF